VKSQDKSLETSLATLLKRMKFLSEGIFKHIYVSDIMYISRTAIFPHRTFQGSDNSALSDMFKF
jgi:hypothetical protein